MRVILKKGKQKELIRLVKDKYTWKEFGEKLGVTEAAIKTWGFEKANLPEEIFKRLNNKKNFERYIISKKEERWGQVEGGKKSSGTTIDIKIPKKSKELAELVGIILGDGNMYVQRKGKHTAVYQLRICGNSEDEKEYLTKFVAPLITKLFGVKVNFLVLKNSKSMYACVSSKKVIEFLKNIGLKTGNSLKNGSRIPFWVNNNKQYLSTCIRGLIDTDGCISRISNKDPQLLRISFKNHNKTLIKQLREGLIKLGFHPSKIICEKQIFLSRKKEVKEYITRIGFNNSKHQKRYLTLAP